MEEIKNLEKANIVGHMHAVDSIGPGHQHLPLGQGRLPVLDAICYLKKKGLDFTITSEAHAEGMPRHIKSTWEALGSPMFRTMATGPPPGGTPRWTEVNQSYFGRHQAPRYVFGSYSPSEDWTLWSGVPME
mgnify:CR=1 FL=1